MKLPLRIAAVCVVVAGIVAVFFLLRSSNTGPSSAATAGTWPMYQYRPDHNAVFPGTFTAHWEYASGGEINGGLAVVGNTLFASNFKKQTFAIDIQNGKPRWVTRPAGNIVMTTPIVTGDLVIVGSGANSVTVDTKDQYLWSVPQGDDVIAYHTKNGASAWTLHTLGEDMPSVGLSGATLVLANGDMHAYGLHATTGKVRWKRTIPGVDTMGSTAIVGSTAYVIASMGVPYQYKANTHVLALDVQDGHTLWSAPYGNSDCSPTVAQGLVFVEASINNRHDPFPIGGHNEVYGIDAHTGKLRWKYTSPHEGFYTSVGSSERAVSGTYANGVLYQSLPVSSEFAAFDATTGKLLWDIDTEGTVKMSPVVSGGLVYFGDSSGLLYVVDAKTGRVKNTHPFRKPFSTASPVVYGKTMFLANTDTVYAIPKNQL